MLKTCFIKLCNLLKFLLKLLFTYATIVLICLVIEILLIIISSKLNINIETCKNEYGVLLLSQLEYLRIIF